MLVTYFTLVTLYFTLVKVYMCVCTYVYVSGIHEYRC